MSLPDELRDPDETPRPPRRSLRAGAVIIIVVAVLLAAVLPVVLGLGG
ncbi:MAG TPA: hypothetical protein VL294_13660 [Pseudolysinimonas sp.]|jgi:hypothetical protein|nr:hypothetical protein [Pseudolysinimonas sp.]